MANTLRLCVLLAAATSAVSAQTTWIVDAQNGPGTHFTKLSSALAVVGAGDTVLLRPGRYHAAEPKPNTPVATITAGLRVLGSSLVTVAGPIRVSNLPLGQSVTLAGFTMIDSRPYHPGPLLRVEACNGHVHLERLTLYAAAWVGSPVEQAGGLDVSASLMVSVTACNIKGGWPALHVAGNSQLAVTSCSLVGSDASDILGTLLPGSPALAVDAGGAYVARSLLQGGSGYLDPNTLTLLPPRPAVHQNGGVTRLLGDSNSLIAGGGGPQPPVGTEAIRLEAGSSTVVGRDVTVRPAGGAGSVWVAPGANAQFGSVPSLAGLGAPPGGTMQLDLFDEVGAAAVFLFAAPAITPTVTNIGAFWVDPARSFATPPVTIGSSRHMTFSVTVPPLPTLAGVVLAIQGGTATTAGVRISNPLLLTLF